jgi:hypothetical protein
MAREATPQMGPWPSVSTFTKRHGGREASGWKRTSGRVNRVLLWLVMVGWPRKWNGLSLLLPVNALQLRCTALGHNDGKAGPR